MSIKFIIFNEVQLFYCEKEFNFNEAKTSKNPTNMLSNVNVYMHICICIFISFFYIMNNVNFYVYNGATYDDP
jgi:hypothetical protein